MAKARLTEKAIDRLPLTVTGYVEYYDDVLKGFGVRCGPKHKVFFVAARVKGRENVNGNPLKIKTNIGRVGITSYSDAVTAARGILEDAAKGIAPDDRDREKDQQRTLDRAKNLTVKEVLDEYCRIRKRLKKTTADSYLEALDRYVHEWLRMPIRDITPDMVVHTHADIGKRSPAQADGVFRIIRALCNYVIETYDDILVKNPVRRLSRLGAWYKVPRKKSYIPPSSLKTWLSAIMERSPDARDYFMGLLFTGARYDELISAKWQDIDLIDGVATFRETKNGTPLIVPVCSFYLDMLRRRKEFLKGTPGSFIFPSSANPTGHMVDLKEHLKAVHKKTGVKATQHDLRRSFLSYADEVGVSPYAQKRLCNHALPQDVTEGYLQFSMERLRRDVEKIAAFILLHAGLRDS